VLVPPDQMKWSPNPDAPEVKAAAAWGDLAKGPHGAFHRLPAGFATHLHTHSSDLRVVVVSGTLIEASENGPETKLPAGSYVYQPHTVKHTTKCEAGSECLLFVVANGKFDIVPAAGKETPKK